MPERKPLLVQRPLQPLADDSGLDLNAKVVAVDAAQGSHALEVERNAPGRRPGPADDARARAVGNHRKTAFLGVVEHACRLCRAGGPDDAAGGRIKGSRAYAKNVARPQITGVGQPVRIAVGDVLRPHDPSKVDHQPCAGAMVEPPHRSAT